MLLYRFKVHFEFIGDLLAGLPVHMAADEDVAAQRRQVLERGLEDRHTLLVFQDFVGQRQVATIVLVAQLLLPPVATRLGIDQRIRDAIGVGDRVVDRLLAALLHHRQQGLLQDVLGAGGIPVATGDVAEEFAFMGPQLRQGVVHRISTRPSSIFGRTLLSRAALGRLLVRKG